MLTKKKKNPFRIDGNVNKDINKIITQYLISTAKDLSDNFPDTITSFYTFNSFMCLEKIKIKMLWSPRKSCMNSPASLSHRHFQAPFSSSKSTSSQASASFLYFHTKVRTDKSTRVSRCFHAFGIYTVTALLQWHRDPSQLILAVSWIKQFLSSGRTWHGFSEWAKPVRSPLVNITFSSHVCPSSFPCPSFTWIDMMIWDDLLLCFHSCYSASILPLS